MSASSPPKKTKVLFVCLGNICRSPLGEIILRAMAFDRKQLDLFEIDSCGTSAYHIGETPDHRSVEVSHLNISKSISEEAYQHFKSIPLHKARQLCIEDFSKYDYIFAMDDSNLNNIKSLKGHRSSNAVITRLGTYHTHKKLNVEDPYYGTLKDFHICYNHIHDCLTNFLKDIDQKETNK
ncbi:hypothetical protein DICPUDRAFT_25972 [Dictyostelium purpureum]|uniref:Phosphotyrosine protein phosphatase I domain-containing protein n=1 Tax=Dictyostelium purpureum TaxID=5786 RepID=F0Z7S7_DICPU|nr:uncharacterized protein DICPUDRAFT_25972 [Dictyostelium purpureum]EGC39996.1 hypothetical protein DICPUDRAFT_25972 [Dictyostelium purpureum]|eukprot:XP_003283499.1 hypothetical protein DICPUDRAFT_25972 [Dictyostelium purpureum]